MPEALRAQTILVTRPAAQAEATARMLRAAGFEPWVMPLIGIEASPNPDGLDRLADHLDDFCCAIFVSANAVEFGVTAIRGRCPWPDGLDVIALGPGTAAALHQAGFEKVVSPCVHFDSEGVLALPLLASDKLAGRHVLIVGGEGGRELLAPTLRQRGATVSPLRVYRRILLPVDVAQLCSEAAAGRLAAICLSSSEAARHLGAALKHAPELLALPVFAPHPRILDAARAVGFAEPILTAAADQGLLAGITRHFA